MQRKRQMVAKVICSKKISGKFVHAPRDIDLFMRGSSCN